MYSNSKLELAINKVDKVKVGTMHKIKKLTKLKLKIYSKKKVNFQS